MIISVGRWLNWLHPVRTLLTILLTTRLIDYPLFAFKRNFPITEFDTQTFLWP